MMRIELHVPITQKEARQRKLPVSTAKLLLQVEKPIRKQTRADLGALGQLALLGVREGRILVAQTIVEYTHLEKLYSELSEKGLRCYYDNELRGGKHKRNGIVIKCLSGEDCARVMEYADTEALVFYNCRTESDVPSVESNLLGVAADGCFEWRWLDFVDRYGHFTFFSSTHMSLEVLGQCEPVLCYFERARQAIIVGSNSR